MVAAGARDAVARCKAGHGGDAAVQVTSWSLLNILGSAQDRAPLPRPPIRCPPSSSLLVGGC
eukprot:2168802-Pyramimonas_sp.AAC.1